MKKEKLSSLLALILLLIISGKAFAGDGIVKNEFTSEGKKRAYYLYVPVSAGVTNPAPLLVLLHGSGRNGKILVEHWQKLAEKEGLILAGPDAQDQSGWASPQDGPKFLYDLVEELKSKQAVDARRVYLFGHSSGAVFSLLMAVMEPNYFAASAVSAGTFIKDDYWLMDIAERKIPVALFVGTKDPLFPVKLVRETRDAFAERKFTVELTEIPNLNHDYYSRSKEINESAWAFLKKYQLAGEPKYKPYKID